MIHRYKFVKGDSRGAYEDQYVKDPRGDVVRYKDHEKALKEAYALGYTDALKFRAACAEAMRKKS